MADDTEEERVKMKSLKLDEPVQGEPNMYTNQPKANSDGHLVKKKTKGDDTVLEKNLHSSPMVMFDLYEAVRDGDTEKVVHLLQRGADPNQISSGCLRRIVFMNDIRIIKVVDRRRFGTKSDF
ncbi:uncharacterized protein [Argopecten irradians]|uniref:uncharacterized protein n=1 Tax=Argopecten irradians TaxID=31199 RepID=UPI00371BA974